MMYTYSSAFEDGNNQSRSAEYIDHPADLAKHHAKKDIARKEKEFEDVIKQRKRSFGPQWGLKQFTKSHHPLAVIVSNNNYYKLSPLTC